MGTSPKSSFFQRLAPGLRPNDGVVQRGNTIRKHNGETKRETTEKRKSEKNKIIFFNLFNCFKILSSKEKNRKSQIFFEICFFEDGHKSQVIIFSTIGSRTSTQKRGSATGTTSRCVSLLWFPLHYPVVGSKSSSQSLKK